MLFYLRAADLVAFMNETEIMAVVSIEMFSISSKINEVTPF
jgi:hypothetical protein